MYQQIYIIFTFHVRLCRLITEQIVPLTKLTKTNRIEPSVILIIYTTRVCQYSIHTNILCIYIKQTINPF